MAEKLSVLVPVFNEEVNLPDCLASVKEIAQQLFLSAGTVRNLSSSAIRKLNGRNRFDAARIAYERGWL